LLEIQQSNQNKDMEHRIMHGDLHPAGGVPNFGDSDVSQQNGSAPTDVESRDCRTSRVAP
jgi:hypothetical protein